MILLAFTVLLYPIFVLSAFLMIYWWQTKDHQTKKRLRSWLKDLVSRVLIILLGIFCLTCSEITLIGVYWAIKTEQFDVCARFSLFFSAHVWLFAGVMLCYNGLKRRYVDNSDTTDDVGRVHISQKEWISDQKANYK